MLRADPNASIVCRILHDGDVVSARQAGRRLAQELGFGAVDQTLIATAISELARNIVKYADRGHIALSGVQGDSRVGLLVVSEDQGPGIEDTELAMRDGFSSGGSLGIGLPGAKRIMDDFSLESRLGEGVIIRAVKWL